jgi:hypothetical protein
MVDVLKEIFDEWRQRTLAKRIKKINKNVAIFHFKKTMTRKIIGNIKK